MDNTDLSKNVSEIPEGHLVVVGNVTLSDGRLPEKSVDFNNPDGSKITFFTYPGGKLFLSVNGLEWNDQLMILENGELSRLFKMPHEWGTPKHIDKLEISIPGYDSFIREQVLISNGIIDLAKVIIRNSG